MNKVKGQYFRVKVGGKVVAMSKSCNIQKQANVEESSTKDTTGNAVENECNSTSWSGSVNGLVAIGADDTSGLNGFDMLALVGETVDIEYYQSQGVKNREEVTSGDGWTGKAIVDSCQLEFPDRADSTYSMNFTGTGELVKKK